MSGMGKTSGRGNKGQKSRSGGGKGRGLLKEGGVFPLFRRLPKVGFNNKNFTTRYQVVNLSSLDERFDNGAHVTAAALHEAGLIRDVKEPVKILGDGELTKKLTVSAHAFSASASGVPAIGANFEVAPRSHSNIVRAWLQFYRAYQNDLTNGDFLPFGDFALPNHRIESAETAFVYLRKIEGPAEIPLAGQPETIYLVNCTDGEEIQALFPKLGASDYQLVVLNELLRTTSEQSIRLDRFTTLRTNIPQGHTIKLTRVSEQDRP
jgi:large subunit ribosomal protein L15